MAEQTAIADPAVPAKGALETPTSDWNRFQDLGKELGDAPETPETPAVPVTPEVKPDVTGQPAATTPDDELARLDELLKADTPTPPTEDKPKPAPAATPELQQVQYWAEHPEFARDAVHAAATTYRISDALSRNDIAGVLANFDQKAQQSIKDHLYEQFKDEFAQRFVDDADGKPSRPDPKMAQLEAQLAKITSVLSDQDKQKVAAEERQQGRQRQQSYDNYWNQLFTTVHVTNDDDRQILEGWVMRALSKDPKAAGNVRAGRLGDIGLKFREIYPRWKDQRKGQVLTAAQVRDQQEQKKSGQLVTAAATTTPGAPEAEPDVNGDGQRTQGFWKRGLSAIKGWND